MTCKVPSNSACDSVILFREPLVFQFVLIASCTATEHHSKEPGPAFFAPLLQVFLDVDKILLRLSQKVSGHVPP